MGKLPPIPDIDVVEGLLVEVGIDAIISRAVERVSPAKLRRAATLPRQIATLARKLVAGELEPTITPADFEWRKAVAELSAGFDLHQVVEMLRQFPPEYQAAASVLVIKSAKLIKELSAGLPLDRYQTFAGSTDLMPADAHIFKFASVLEVVRNPLIVFSLMAGGALLKIQSNAVRETYPTISASIDAALFGATYSAKSANKSFELPPKVEYGVSKWMGKAPAAPGVLKQAQQNAAAANQKKQPQTPPPQGAKKSAGMLTAGQKAEAGTGPTP